MRFGKTVQYTIASEYAAPPSATSGIYKKTRRNGPATYYTDEFKQRCEHSAHANAVRCESRDAAEAVLLLMHRLRRHAPSAWNATGKNASAEDHMRAFLSSFNEPPPPPRPTSWCQWLSMETIQRVLLGCETKSNHDALYCHEKLHED